MTASRPGQSPVGTGRSVVPVRNGTVVNVGRAITDPTGAPQLASVAKEVVQAIAPGADRS